MADEKFCCTWVALADVTSKTHQSQWLQETLSYADKKVGAIRAIVEDDGDRSQIVQILEELKKSYCALAEGHDQLRSKFSDHQDARTSASPFNPKILLEGANDDASGVSESPKMDTLDSPPESAVTNPEVEFDNFHFEILDELADDIVQDEPPSANLNQVRPIGGEIHGEHTDMGINEEIAPAIHGSETNQEVISDPWTEHLGRGMKWNKLKLQVTKLMEENLQKQAELVKRNEEKRGIIRGLRSRLNGLKAENKALQDCLVCSKANPKGNQFQMTRLKGLVLSRIFGRSSQ
ncbi:uncharacterized protein LOC115747497 [Rhodamnia argentea]|uniref:Uncharacterized protein LOC115747497 n=1 Tax=Rhodamnia argentea TaxID=178133 RepID=A0A8B8PXM0_9MYRT|nr:uncharacterized protein LOC115747497 [Rhodamnia argentea]